MNKNAILEGALFVVGDEGLTIKQIMELLNIDLESAKKILQELAMTYEKEDRGIAINLLGNAFKLTTKSEHKDYYESLLEIPGTNALSNAALETLVIVAYNEPITRLKVDKLRGVHTSHMIRKLVAHDLIKEVGREESPGRPILYATTNAFLDCFGLASLEELPEIPKIEKNLTETDLFI